MSFDSNCEKAANIVRLSDNLSENHEGIRKVIKKAIKEIDDNGRYARFIAHLKELNGRRDPKGTLVLKNLRAVKTALGRFAGSGEPFSEDERVHILEFLELWNAHVKAEEAALRCASGRTNNDRTSAKPHEGKRFTNSVKPSPFVR